MSDKPDEKVDAWMPLWIGSYLADTMDLSRDEHGGYLLLLMAYWRNRGPLADKGNRLANICKASPSEWEQLRPVLVEFFAEVNGHWVHGRADKELAAAGIRKAAASSKAKAAAEARWGKSSEQTAKQTAKQTPEQCSEHAPCIAQAVPEQCPTPSPISSSLRSEDPPLPPKGGETDPPEPAPKPKPKPKRKRRTVALTTEGMVRFETFYRAYPKKVARQDACAAFLRIDPSDELLEAMLEAIKRQGLAQKVKDGEGRYVKNPAAWLNSRRWEDEVPSTGGGLFNGVPIIGSAEGRDPLGNGVSL